jgi:hypothetical protein
MPFKMAPITHFATAALNPIEVIIFALDRLQWKIN